jgi:hypothetical protein
MDSTASNSVDNYAPSYSQRVEHLGKDFVEAGYVFLLALALVGILFLLQENIDLNLADEGFLWYGAIQTTQGYIPLTDFQAYDPGRYYWIAAWFTLFGQDIMALRLAVALFQVLGLTLGLLAAKRVVANWWLLALIGVVLLVWMFPRHKLFEPSLAMASVYLAVRLLEKPTSRQYFISGVFVGLAAFFGRNHGLYSFAAFFLLILFLWFKRPEGSLFAQIVFWLSGIIVGYAPMWLMWFFIPGMFSDFIGWVVALSGRGSSNLSLPVPWPWMVDYTQTDLISGLSGFFVGFFFLLLPLLYLGAAASILLTRPEDIQRRSLLIASTCVGIFYMHYAFSRADLGHLAQGIHPFLLGLVALPQAFRFERRQKVVGAGLATLCLATILAIIPANPYWQKLKANPPFVSYNISGRQLWLRQEQAAYIEAVKQVVTQHIGSAEELLIAPHSPTLYPILQRQSPIWETYLLFPETEERQREIIQVLEARQVNWAILADSALDSRDELRFRNTHPLVWQYLMNKFEPVETPGLPVNQYLLHRRVE